MSTTTRRGVLRGLASLTIVLASGCASSGKTPTPTTDSQAVAGEHKLTLRVTEVGPGRPRLSMLVGGGHDAEANQHLADEIVEEICARLGTTCE